MIRTDDSGRRDDAPVPSGTDAEDDGGVDASMLLRHRRELVIRHGSERYVLRLTSNNKLILTK